MSRIELSLSRRTSIVGTCSCVGQPAELGLVQRTRLTLDEQFDCSAQGRLGNGSVFKISLDVPFSCSHDIHISISTRRLILPTAC